MNLYIYPYIFCIIIVIFVVSIYLVSYANNIVFDSTYSLKFDNIQYSTYELTGKYLWPVIGYNNITSYYGRRKAPTAGASTFHRGIDIGAPTGSNLVSIMDGIVIMSKFNGANGFSIIVQNGNMQAIYAHVHDKYLPALNTKVKKGQVIGKVGPKNVYNVPNNPYKDSNGNPTNGTTTGAHLHFSIKINGEYVNPLEYI
ncbi:MAG: M23 family metallopeptidase [Clostridiales bacterium]|nr:M23 family metallopeptidase [Clostridiales bacterium]